MSHDLVREAQMLGLLYFSNLFQGQPWHVLGTGEEIYFRLLSLSSVKHASLGEEGKWI